MTTAMHGACPAHAARNAARNARRTAKPMPDHAKNQNQNQNQNYSLTLACLVNVGLGWAGDPVVTLARLGSDRNARGMSRTEPHHDDSTTKQLSDDSRQPAPAGPPTAQPSPRHETQP